jgi:RNA polymerase sigma-70 factor (ECF subfamily)
MSIAAAIVANHLRGASAVGVRRWTLLRMQRETTTFMSMSESHANPGDQGRQRHSSDLLERAFHDCQDGLFGTLYYLVGNGDDAREAFQETFAKCWRLRRNIAEVSDLKVWIFRIAMGAARDFRDAAGRPRRTSLADPEASPLLADEFSQADAARREQIAVARKTLMRLRPNEQEIFLLRQNAQMTYEQIAQAINLPVGIVKTRMRLALRKLREALEAS